MLVDNAANGTVSVYLFDGNTSDVAHSIIA